MFSYKLFTSWWIQGLSRICVMRFKDFQAPVLFSSTFKALNLEDKKFKCFQGLSRMRGNPVGGQWCRGWNQINGDLGQIWISSLASLPELDITAIQNCTKAHFSSIVGKFRCWLGTRTGQLLLQELEPLQWHACFRCTIAAFRKLLSALLSFPFWIFSFYFVFIV